MNFFQRQYFHIHLLFLVDLCLNHGQKFSCSFWSNFQFSLNISMAEKSELSKRCLYRNTFAHGASAFSREEKCNSLCYHQMVPSKKKN